MSAKESTMVDLTGDTPVYSRVLDLSPDVVDMTLFDDYVDLTSDVDLTTGKWWSIPYNSEETWIDVSDPVPCREGDTVWETFHDIYVDFLKAAEDYAVSSDRGYNVPATVSHMRETQVRMFEMVARACRFLYEHEAYMVEFLHEENEEGIPPGEIRFMAGCATLVKMRDLMEPPHGGVWKMTEDEAKEMLYRFFYPTL